MAAWGMTISLRKRRAPPMAISMAATEMMSFKRRQYTWSNTNSGGGDDYVDDDHAASRTRSMSSMEAGHGRAQGFLGNDTIYGDSGNDNGSIIHVAAGVQSPPASG